MKKTLILIIIATLMVTTVVIGCGSPEPSPASPTTPTSTISQPAPAAPSSTKSPSPVAQQTWNLKFSHEHTQISYYQKYGHEVWVKEIEQATNGRVKITIYPSQTLMKTAQAWEGVKSGIADIAWIFTGYMPGQFDYSDSIGLPFMSPNGEVGSRVAWSLYQKYPEIQNQYKDVKVLAVWTSEPHTLVSSKKQIKTMDDIKGLKVRMTGGPPTEMMKLLGGTPMMISMPDTYINLQKGTIDAAQTSYEPYTGYKIYEVAPYITHVPLVSVNFSLIMNEQLWESFPKDIQDAIMSVSGEKLSLKYGRDVHDQAKKDTSEIVSAAGAKLYEYTLPPEEFNKWVEIAGKPIWDAWVKKIQEKGMSNAQQLLDDTIKLAKEYNQ